MLIIVPYKLSTLYQPYASIGQLLPDIFEDLINNQIWNSLFTKPESQVVFYQIICLRPSISLH